MRAGADRRRPGDWASPLLLATMPVLLAVVALTAPQQHAGGAPGGSAAEASPPDPRPALIHPLLGVDRTTLIERVGRPDRHYRGAGHSFLEYRIDADLFQVVLRDDRVVEVSTVR